MYRGRVYPGISVAGVPAAGLNPVELTGRVKQRVTVYEASWPQRFRYEAYEWLVPYPTQKLKYDAQATTQAAYHLGRQGKILRRLATWWQLWQTPQDLPIQLTLDESWLTDLSASLAATLTIEVRQPSINLLPAGEENGGSRIQIEPGESGQIFDQHRFETQTRNKLAWLQPLLIEGLVEKQPITVTEEELDQVKKRAENLLKKKIIVKPEPETEAWELSGEELVGFIAITGGYDQERLMEYLEGVAEGVNRAPQDAKFKFNDETQKVEEFLPAKDGLTVAIPQSVEQMKMALDKLETMNATEPATLAVVKTPPAISLENVNDLGIKELIGRGESTYFHSITTRVNNVNLASSRISGTLIKPGETFSFNQALGDVSAATGYQPAYIIKEGRTILGDGGGVCQVSTTTFRAALNTGLPIVERQAHAYRVGYYEQDTKAGIDATVYAPNPDLKFTNDTLGHILIQTENDIPNRHLVIDIYGTSDGRKSQITNHVVWGITPPLPDVFVDDPTLPMGEVKQVDWKAAGAKAKFDYQVVREGEIIFEKTFTSNYRPWASVFLRGTK